MKQAPEEWMRVSHFDSPGEAECLRLTTRKKPAPGDGELLVQVVSAGVNRADILQRRGFYPAPPGESDILGLEIAGRVVETGNKVTRFQSGDCVFGLVAGGGYAEFCLLHEDLAMALPEGWSFDEGAAVTEAFFTANENLFFLGGLTEGETVLIHAGGSGVGSAAIQMAKHAGASIFTTAGSSEKLARCQQLGADVAIHYRQEDFVQIVKHHTNDQGVACILDFIGAKYLDRNINALKSGGRLLVVGLLGGAKAELNLAKMMAKRLCLQGSVMRSLPLQEKAAIRRRFESRWWPLLKSGSMKPVHDRSFSLAQAAEAHRYMEASQHFGKITLRIST